MDELFWQKSEIRWLPKLNLFLEHILGVTLGEYRAVLKDTGKTEAVINFNNNLIIEVN